MRLATKATHQQTRAINQGLVLRTIYDLGPISRAEIARVTDLTRTSVSDLVGDAIADGLVEEVGRGPSSGGKAPILVQIVDDARLPLSCVREVMVLDPLAKRDLLGPNAEQYAFVIQRPWVAGAVQIILADPTDPTPYWLISSRRPAELAATLTARSVPSAGG